MCVQLNTKSKSLAGLSDLTVIAFIKPGPPPAARHYALSLFHGENGDSTGRYVNRPAYSARLPFTNTTDVIVVRNLHPQRAFRTCEFAAFDVVGIPYRLTISPDRKNRLALRRYRRFFRKTGLLARVR